jgi:hypothetical protein
MNGPYRILVTGSRDWDDAQEVRFALIRASVPHLPSIVVIHGACPAGTMTAEWASDYGVRTEPPGGGTPDVCLAFGDSPDADEAERAGIPVRRVTRTVAA